MKKILEEKKQLLQKLLTQFQQTQQSLNNLSQQILKVQGAIDQLEELLKKEK